MFDFSLGDTADTMREMTARFASELIAPIAAEIDETNTFPRQLWPEMGALDLHGITVEEEFGGSGMGYLHHRDGRSVPRVGFGGA
jgi:isovaleryl-CoA dehydrogenase